MLYCKLALLAHILYKVHLMEGESVLGRDIYRVFSVQKGKYSIGRWESIRF